MTETKLLEDKHADGSQKLFLKPWAEALQLSLVGIHDVQGGWNIFCESNIHC